MLKSRISAALRTLGLLYAADMVRFRIEKWRHAAKNREFRRQHPDFVLPPGLPVVRVLSPGLRKIFSERSNSSPMAGSAYRKIHFHPELAILDWGCGPGRIIRHLPALLPGSQITGSDYNAGTIAWCRVHLPGITFKKTGWFHRWMWLQIRRMSCTDFPFLRTCPKKITSPGRQKFTGYSSRRE
jgi:hypothetical protein